LASYPEAQLNQAPAANAWSALQTAHHLILSEQGSLAYVRKKMSFETQFPKTGLRESWRSFLVWVLLYQPIKFKAPEKVGGNPELLPAHSTLQEVRDAWHAILTEWREFFEQMPEAIADRTVYKHPRVGKIGWLHMIAFFSVHFARHRKQIFRALAAAQKA
jgi:hypothetical protein